MLSYVTRSLDTYCIGTSLCGNLTAVVLRHRTDLFCFVAAVVHSM
jgi:hypothetical protein